MDEIEHRLKQERLLSPSQALDRRIADAVAAAKRRAERSQQPWKLWWSVATFAAGCAAIYLVTNFHTSTRRDDIVYHIQAQGQMREMLIGNSSNEGDAPVSDVQVNLH